MSVLSLFSFFFSKVACLFFRPILALQQSELQAIPLFFFLNTPIGFKNHWQGDTDSKG